MADTLNQTDLPPAAVINVTSTEATITPYVPKLPSMAQQIAQGVARHALTGLAGMLVTRGALQKDQTTQFIEIGSAVAVWLAGVAWSSLQKVAARRRLKTAIKTVPAPIASVLMDAAAANIAASAVAAPTSAPETSGGTNAQGG